MRRAAHPPPNGPVPIRSRTAALGRASALLALAALAVGCEDPCFIFPTRVDLVVEPPFVEAPGEVVATADTVLGITNCGPNPTEVVAYHWRLDGEDLEGEDGEPLGESIVLAFDEPGLHVVEVRIEDDLGKELPYVGHSAVFVY